MRDGKDSIFYCGVWKSIPLNGVQLMICIADFIAFNPSNTETCSYHLKKHKQPLIYFDSFFLPIHSSPEYKCKRFDDEIHDGLKTSLRMYPQILSYYHAKKLELASGVK